MDFLLSVIKGACMAVGLATIVFSIPRYTEAKSQRNDDDAYKVQYRIITGVIIFAIGASPVVDTIISYLNFTTP